MNIARQKSFISMGILLQKSLIEIYKTDAVLNFWYLWIRFYKYKNKLIIYLRDFIFKFGDNIIVCKYIKVYNRKYSYYDLYYNSKYR